MDYTLIDNFIDLSFMVALFVASQLEKKLDLFGKIIKRNTSDTVKVFFIGSIHSAIWIYFFRPEDISLHQHIKIIGTSWMAMVVFYDYFIKRFLPK